MKKIPTFVVALLCTFVLALALYQSSSEADDRGNTTKREMAGFRATGELPLPKEMVQPKSSTTLKTENLTALPKIARGTTVTIPNVNFFGDYSVAFADETDPDAMCPEHGDTFWQVYTPGNSLGKYPGQTNGYNFTASDFTQWDATGRYGTDGHADLTITVPLDAPLGVLNFNFIGVNGQLSETYYKNRVWYKKIHYFYNDFQGQFEVVEAVGPPTDCPSGTHDDGTGNCIPDTDPIPSPTPDPTPSPTPDPTATPTSVPSPMPSPSPTGEPYPTPPVDYGPTPTPAPTATPYPTAMPTATPTPTPSPTPGPPSLALALDKSQIVAGGWDETRQAYEYLEKESGQWKSRDQKPDPHIATATATLTDSEGHPMAGQTVTFKWDMPGPAPEETRAATTDSDGVATVDIVSGDTLSKAFDEKDGHLLYDEPVEVEASYGDLKETKRLDVLAAQAQWQYKDEQGDYQIWDGRFETLFAGKNEIEPSSLQVALSFDGQPVTGHRVKWKIARAWNMWDNPVETNADGNFTGYGHLSGDYSTTNQDGNARATYTFGRRIGKLKFMLTDSSVLKSVSSSTISEDVSFNSSFPTAAIVAEADGKTFNSIFTTGKFDVYTWVKGVAAYKNLYAYPAPSGLEDYELLEETDDLVKLALRLVGSESLHSKRGPGPSNQNGDWWYAQVIGMDSASGIFHRADMSWIPPGAKNPELHGAAFDIVLTNVDVFADVRPRQKKPLRVKTANPKSFLFRFKRDCLSSSLM